MSDGVVSGVKEADVAALVRREFTVPVSSHCFLLMRPAGWDVDDLDDTAGADKPFVRGGADIVFVKTGISMGPVEVEVVVTDVAPGPPDRQWEEVVEVPLDVSEGDLRVRGAESMIIDEQGGSVLSAGEAATYRVCVSAQGRHRQPDQVVQSSSERYLLELWEQHPEPFSVLRSKDWAAGEITDHIV